MDAPADRSTRTAGPPPQPAAREAVRQRRRRRPSGEPPPLPHHLQTSGIRWLVAMLVLMALAIVVFARGLRGIAVDVTVVDVAVVGWLAGIDLPGFQGLMRASRRPQLLVGAEQRVLRADHRPAGAAPLPAPDHLGGPRQRAGGDRLGHPRPDRPAAAAVRGGDPGGLGRLGHAGMYVTFFAVGLVTILYTLVPEGRWRNTGKWVVTALVTLNALGRMALGADAPTDVLVGVALGVTIPLVAYRWFTPNEIFPISYRRGQRRPPGRRRGQGGGDPARPGGPARPGRHRGQAVRPVRVGRLHPAADHRRGRPARAAVRQAVRPQPPALGPLVQAGPGAAVWPPGGREAVQHRAAAGPAGGLRAVADAAGRAAQPDPATGSSS